MNRHRITCLSALAAVTLAACGDDGEQTARPNPTATPAAVASAERYCALGRELDAAGEAHFASLGRDAGPEQYAAAERDFLEAQASRLREVQAAAPAEIADDVRTLLAAQRRRAGLDAAGAPSDREATAAEERVKRYERRNC